VFSSFFLLFCADAVAQQASTNLLSSNSQYVPQHFRAHYEAGFSRVMAFVPDIADRPQYAPLVGIKHFKEDKVRWAKIEGDSFVALEPGSAKGGWIAVIPSGHEMLTTQENTYQIDENTSLNALRIKPEKISEFWAGVFLVHELSHLADRVFEVEPVNPTRKEYLLGEARAYNLEMMLADLVSKGAYQKRLDTILGKWKPVSAKFLIEKMLSNDFPELRTLDTVVSKEKAESPVEYDLRSGFHVLSMYIRYSENQAAGEEDFLRGLNTILLTAAWTDDVNKW
jgi:hypothetical protein